MTGRGGPAGNTGWTRVCRRRWTLIIDETTTRRDGFRPLGVCPQSPPRCCPWRMWERCFRNLKASWPVNFCCSTKPPPALASLPTRSTASWRRRGCFRCATAQRSSSRSTRSTDWRPTVRFRTNWRPTPSNSISTMSNQSRTKPLASPRTAPLFWPVRRSPTVSASEAAGRWRANWRSTWASTMPSRTMSRVLHESPPAMTTSRKPCWAPPARWMDSTRWNSISIRS